MILLFDGRDEVELDAARQQWTRLKAEGRALAYWRQSDSGKWDRQM
jgi:DNA polymerase-3 subunit chi